MSRKPKVIPALKVMGCRCGQLMSLAEMRWFTPPRPRSSGSVLIRQVICPACHDAAERSAPCHVETFVEDYTLRPTVWGWECLTCRADHTGYLSATEAESAGELHRAERAGLITEVAS